MNYEEFLALITLVHYLLAAFLIFFGIKDVAI